MSKDFTRLCDELRTEIEEIGKRTRALQHHPVFSQNSAYPGQQGEMKANMMMKANIMLSYRHLEDARMRVGKILQAADDGVSILDKTPNVSDGDVNSDGGHE